MYIIFISAHTNFKAFLIKKRRKTAKRRIIIMPITSKELTAVEDQLTIEQNVISKYRMYAQTATDAVIKNKCEDIACKHQKHFDLLLAQLNE